MSILTVSPVCFAAKYSSDWRENRFELERELSADMLARLKREIDPKALVIDTKGDSVQVKKVLSASSAVAVAQQQVQQSPTQSKASNITNFDMDSISDTMSMFKGQQTGKRKASSALSDDEIEIIEGAVLPATSAKKQKDSKAAKTRARKK